MDDITAAIARSKTERETAIENGKEAEASWRIRFRSLRGNLTDELKAEHSQHIASRELAEEFTGLIEELALRSASVLRPLASSAARALSFFSSILCLSPLLE